ncbi:DUF1917 domain-containing protein [Legionella israelensis]|uniref:DUF1917 domain-containing protein n=1 Tax=Legionella israelensis TaxID=454 RepID=A0AAX1EFU5_9GAMM|nr:putative phosphothreonine lyase domain-containg protein [Legionella israelensis]QBR83976.1 DUF1917 domain-containing protein [Legionella israelensis]
MAKPYHFSFDKDGNFKASIVSETRITSEEKLINSVKPSILSDKDDIHLGYVSIEKQHDRKETQNEGKWTLYFPKGAKEIDEAWALLIEMVKQGISHKIEITVSSSNNDFQVVSVYTKDRKDLKDVLEVYDQLKDKQLIDKAKACLGKEQTAIEYKTVIKKGYVLRENCEQIDYQEYDTDLLRILSALEEHPKYILHGGGKKVDGKKYSESAGLIVEKIKQYFRYISSKEKCDEILQYTQNQLRYKNQATKGSCFFGLGGRHQTTAELYSKVYQQVQTLMEKNEEKENNMECV